MRSQTNHSLSRTDVIDLLSLITSEAGRAAVVIYHVTRPWVWIISTFLYFSALCVTSHLTFEATGIVAVMQVLALSLFGTTLTIWGTIAFKVKQISKWAGMHHERPLNISGLTAYVGKEPEYQQQAQHLEIVTMNSVPPARFQSLYRAVQLFSVLDLVRACEKRLKADLSRGLFSDS